MDYTKATKKQLLQIALNEACPIEFKYRACSELQMRWNQNMLIDLIRMYGQKKEIWEIAEYLGVSERTVRAKIHIYKLYRGRVGA